MSAERRQAPEGGWGSLKADELKDELEARGLPKSGKKDELVARLEEDDASGEGAPEAAAAAEAPEALAEAEPAAGEGAAEPVAEEVIPPEEPAEEPKAEEVADEEPAEAEEEPAGAGEEPAEEEEAVPEGPVADEEPTPEEAPASAQRGAAAPGRDGALVVTARAKYVRSAPRKARLVMDHIRGKNVEQAQAILRHAPRAISEDILKLLKSAVANAESNYELGADELRIQRAFVDEGPTIKRYRPRARGRATRILQRTRHMTIEPTTTEGNGR
jgi:ribosomal protein L22